MKFGLKTDELGKSQAEAPCVRNTRVRKMADVCTVMHSYAQLCTVMHSGGDEQATIEVALRSAVCVQQCGLAPVCAARCEAGAKQRNLAMCEPTLVRQNSSLQIFTITDFYHYHHHCATQCVHCLTGDLWNRPTLALQHSTC